LYAIGDNTFGELGVDGVSASDNKLLKVSEFDDAIYKIATGARHSLILLKNGELYAFGDNSDGQCTGYTTRYPSPTKISFDIREKIIDVYSGYNSCLIILGIYY
jgi:alpha-tubulin suppressor-like RCC1 family protein